MINYQPYTPRMRTAVTIDQGGQCGGHFKSLMKVLAVLADIQLYRAFRACCAVWDAIKNSD